MKLLDRCAFKILMTLVLAFPGAPLIAQSTQSPKPSQADNSSRTYRSVLDYSDILRRLDADRDGFITRNEWERFFDDNDKDADKRLALEEIRSLSAGRSAEEELEPNHGRLTVYERLDANKNDAIESSEWPGKEKDFRYLDANHNRSLSREEFLSRDGRYWNETFDNLDFDEDGIILRSEWLDSDSSFDSLDRDHNGVIERREFYNPR